MIIEKCTEISASKRFKSVQKLRGALVTLLSTPHHLEVSKGAEEWENKLNNAEAWSVHDFENFVRYLKQETSDENRWALFRSVDEEKSVLLERLDHEVWEAFGEEYCSWARGSFSFAYCDVLIRRLEIFFEHGSPGMKARVAIAAAILGASHNRWFVMERLMKMCGPELDDQIAQRISIEITVEEVESSFMQCAERISREITDYHPRIATLLGEI